MLGAIGNVMLNYFSLKKVRRAKTTYNIVK